MRRFFRGIGRVLTAPIRGVSRLFRPVHEFLTQDHDPEEVPITDSFASVLQDPKIILGHIEALRRHLLRSILALFVTTFLSFTFAERLLVILAVPVGGLENLQAISVTEPLGVFMRISLLSGFALAFPFVALEFFLFVQSGLKPGARLRLLLGIPAATLMFIGGMAFTYYVMLPTAIPFLTGFLDITTRPRVDDYVRFVTGIMFWIGLSFQFPLVIYLLAEIGLIKARSLANQWRLAFIIIAVLAAAVTPTVDPVNMSLVMAPMIVLYFLSIGLAFIAQRDRRTSE